ncbi:PorT family protein [Litoribacter ruber]|uniref:porin family protein n=1 Tax=Litoribacter ruber TaxID=702568 RepID=UPI001BDB366C|nr:porin family protein [Litoribacter ruber]MBT0809794.1 PorT family protein [Litoribacter ruber]
MIGRIFLLAMLLIGAAVEAEAQSSTSIGVRYGISSSNVSYRSIPATPNRRTGDVQGNTFGIVIEQFFAKNAGAQIEVQWVTHGYAETDTLGNINESQLDYLKIPLLSNFYFGNKNRFHIKLGPHFGTLLGSRDISRTHEFNELGFAAMPTYGQEQDDPKRFMYGLTGGVGISRLLGRNTIQAEVRFGYEFGRPERFERVYDMNFTNLEFTLSYLFAVLKKP